MRVLMTMRLKSYAVRFDYLIRLSDLNVVLFTVLKCNSLETHFNLSAVKLSVYKTLCKLVLLLCCVLHGYTRLLTVAVCNCNTVTDALVLRPLLEVRERITESIRILVPVNRIKQKCFQITTKRVRRSQPFQLRR